jgi:hypothetical protein
LKLIFLLEIFKYFVAAANLSKFMRKFWAFFWQNSSSWVLYDEKLCSTLEIPLFFNLLALANEILKATSKFDFEGGMRIFTLPGKKLFHRFP